VEGKIAVAKFARERQIPFFGICLGMQCAVIDVARHVAKLGKAHSTEFAPKTPHPVVDMMLEQKNHPTGRLHAVGGLSLPVKGGFLGAQSVREGPGP
jgi:CTP synthase (UTP-ammonia lyase)